MVPTLFVKFVIPSFVKLIFLLSVTCTFVNGIFDVFVTIILYPTTSPSLTSGIAPDATGFPFTLITVFVILIDGNVFTISNPLYVTIYPSGIFASSIEYVISSAFSSYTGTSTVFLNLFSSFNV